MQIVYSQYIGAYAGMLKYSTINNFVRFIEQKFQITLEEFIKRAAGSLEFRSAGETSKARLER